jgi:IS30 family transposase
MMVEDLRKLLQELGDGNLQQIAIWKMEGYTNREIANMIGKSEPTVERKLKIIRETWLRKEPKSL